jgi:hypothetical protein
VAVNADQLRPLALEVQVVAVELPQGGPDCVEFAPPELLLQDGQAVQLLFELGRRVGQVMQATFEDLWGATSNSASVSR